MNEHEVNGVDAHVESQAITKREGSIAALGTAPTEIIENGVAIANQLKRIVTSAKLVKNISGKNYVMAEGWTTLGAMLSVFPQVEWTKRLDMGQHYAWECRVLLIKDGKTLASAESMAASNEGAPWARQEYSVRSMAQTRATGKAFRLAFSWVMTLAGFEPTPAEEMPEPRRAEAARDAARDGKEPAAPIVPGWQEAMFDLKNAMANLYKKRPDIMPHGPSLNTKVAIKARLDLLSQVIGMEVSDVTKLTVEQVKHATAEIKSQWGV